MGAEAEILERDEGFVRSPEPEPAGLDGFRGTGGVLVRMVVAASSATATRVIAMSDQSTEIRLSDALKIRGVSIRHP
jgi:hypothetical protein